MATTRIQNLPEITNIDDVDVFPVNYTDASSSLPQTGQVNLQVMQDGLGAYDISQTTNWVLNGGGANSIYYTTPQDYEIVTGNASAFSGPTL